MNMQGHDQSAASQVNVKLDVVSEADERTELRIKNRNVKR